MPLLPIVRNAADPKQVKRAERTEARRFARFASALKAVMATPEGRYVLRTIIDDAGMLRSSFDTNGSMMYFKEGRRSFGLEIRAACVEVDEELVLLMDTEGTAQRRADESEIKAGHISDQAAAEGDGNG
jgi:hypothetical protein